MVFLAAVLLAAVLGGPRPVDHRRRRELFVYDFFFVEPHFTFTVTKPQDILSLVTFLVVAVLTSQLTARVRAQADAARRRELRTAALYAFTRDIAGANGLDDLARVLTEHVAQLLHTRVALLLAESGRLAVAAHVAGRRDDHRRRARGRGLGAPARPAGRARHEHARRQRVPALPLSTVAAPSASCRSTHGEGDWMPLDQRQLVESITHQAAVAIERMRVDVVEAVIESIEDGLVVLSPDGVVEQVNEVACAILDVERSAAQGARFEELGTSHPHYLRLRAAVADILAHPEREAEPVEFAMFLRGRDHFYVLRPTPFRALDGTPAGSCSCSRTSRICATRRRAASSSWRRSRTSSARRSPRFAWRRELLRRREGELDDEARSLVDAVHEDVLRLEDVAQRLLDVSRSRAMSIALERTPVDLKAIVARVGRLFALQARERNVALDTRAPDGDVSVMGDPTKITWAVSNLIANALRYTPAGGRVDVTVHVDDGTARIAVADTGPGIPPIGASASSTASCRTGTTGEPPAWGSPSFVTSCKLTAGGSISTAKSGVAAASRSSFRATDAWPPSSSSTTRRTSAPTWAPTCAGSATTCTSPRTRRKRWRSSSGTTSTWSCPTCA
jgi:signal transduction histidine kinase